MNTELIIFSQQLVANPKFTLLTDYGWSFTGAWTKTEGLITKTAGSGTLFQNQLLIVGAKYQLKYTISSSATTGTVQVTDGVSTIHFGSSNGSYTIDFTASGQDIVFTTNATFNAAISNVTITSLPVSFNLDLDEEIPIPLTFNIDTVFDVSKRKTPYSKTTVLSGTHNNNIAFNHIYKVNSQSLFNPNLKSEIIIKNKGITAFKGVLCLDDVTKKINNSTEYISYSVSLTGDVISVIDRLGNKTIRNLDFSDYDHVFSVQSISDSWLNSISINGTPAANRINTYTSPAVTAETPVVFGGLNRIKIKFVSNHGFAVGDEVYVTPGVGQLPLQWSFDQLVINVPATDEIILDAYNPSIPYSGTGTSVVTKEMLAGYGYWYPCVNNGTWMKNYFANGFHGGTGLLTSGETYIINTYNTGDDFTNVGAVTNIDGEIFTAALGSQTSGQLIINQTYQITLFNAGDDFSNLGAENVSGSTFTVFDNEMTDGPLIIGQDYLIVVHHPSDDFVSVGAASNNTGVTFTATGTIPAIWAHGSVIKPINFVLPTTWASGSVVAALTAYPTLWTSPTILTTLRDTALTSDTLQDKGHDFYLANDNYWECYDFVPHIFLREVLLKIFKITGFEYNSDLFDSKLFRRLIIPCEQTFCNSGLIDGNTISMNTITPNIKLSDILISVINMFNLAVIPSDDDAFTLKFVNRNNFFSNTPIDWTQKLDTSSDFSLQMMNRSLPKTYQFKYSDGSDFYNTEYNTDFGNLYNGASLPNLVDRRYGDEFLNIKSDYLTSENKVQLIFEPSVMSDDTERSQMLYSSTFYSNGTTVSREVSNRVLIAGLRWMNNGSFNAVSKLNSSINVGPINFYPYAGNFDNHLSPFPKWDINFSKPLGVYFTGSTFNLPSNITSSSWGDNSLYNLYWSKYIQSISNPNSKIVTGFFKISIIDIYKIDFQTPIIVGDFKLRLNKIIDWDINGTGICKCEFLYAG